MGGLCLRRAEEPTGGLDTHRLENWELDKDDMQRYDDMPDELTRLRRRVRDEDINRSGRMQIYKTRRF